MKALGREMSVTLAWCTAPSTWMSWIAVWKADSACPTLPLKVTMLREGATSRTVKPCEASQAESAATSASLRPKRAPYSSCVSHW